MKLTPILAVALFAAISSFAQDAATVDPPELITAREQNNRDLQRASIPVLQQYLLTLNRLQAEYTRDQNFGALTAVQNEASDVQKQIVDATNATDLTRPVSDELTILSATYGVQPITVDVTAKIQKELRTGDGTAMLNNEAYGNIDPAPGASKQTKIVYSINGKRKEKIFPEGHVLNVHDELN
jgi:hypothetical protein